MFCSHAFHTTLVVKQKGTIEVKIVLILDSPMANLLFRSSHMIRLYNKKYTPARLHPNMYNPNILADLAGMW